MLHQMLSLHRPLFVLDCETTGINPQVDRVIELGFQMWTADGMQKEWRSLIDPGIEIPTGSHGLTTEDFLMTPKFADLAQNLALGFQNCDYAGKHVRFDLKILWWEFNRAGVPWSYADARIVDADRLEQIGEPRTLSHLYRKHIGQEPEGAHQALADVKMTTEVICAQLRKYDALPRDLAALHDLQWPGWIDTEGKFRFVDGVPCFSQWGKFALQPMRHADRGYWDFILKKDFSPEIKEIARRAKAGQFPEMP